MALLGGVAAASDDPHPAVDGFTTAVYPALLLVVAFLLDAVANDRWQAQAQAWQPGQRVQAHWPREAMTVLQETEGR